MTAAQTALEREGHTLYQQVTAQVEARWRGQTRRRWGARGGAVLGLIGLVFAQTQPGWPLLVTVLLSSGTGLLLAWGMMSGPVDRWAWATNQAEWFLTQHRRTLGAECTWAALLRATQTAATTAQAPGVSAGRRLVAGALIDACDRLQGQPVLYSLADLARRRAALPTRRAAGPQAPAANQLPARVRDLAHTLQQQRQQFRHQAAIASWLVLLVGLLGGLVNGRLDGSLFLGAGVVSLWGVGLAIYGLGVLDQPALQSAEALIWCYTQRLTLADLANLRPLVQTLPPAPRRVIENALEQYECQGWFALEAQVLWWAGYLLTHQPCATEPTRQLQRQLRSLRWQHRLVSRRLPVRPTATLTRSALPAWLLYSDSDIGQLVQHGPAALPPPDDWPPPGGSLEQALAPLRARLLTAPPGVPTSLEEQ